VPEGKIPSGGADVGILPKGMADRSQTDSLLLVELRKKASGEAAEPSRAATGRDMPTGEATPDTHARMKAAAKVRVCMV